jgi:hypothetical protein
MGDRAALTIRIYRADPAKVDALKEYIMSEWAPETGEELLQDEFMTPEIPLGAVFDGEVTDGLLEIDPTAVWKVWQDPKYETLGDLAIHHPILGLYREECDASGEPRPHFSVVDERGVQLAFGRDWANAIDVITGEAKPELGSFVRTSRHGYTGRIYQIHDHCPEGGGGGGGAVDPAGGRVRRGPRHLVLDPGARRWRGRRSGRQCRGHRAHRGLRRPGRVLVMSNDDTIAYGDEIVPVAPNRRGLLVVRMKGGEFDGSLSIEMRKWPDEYETERHPAIPPELLVERSVVYLAEDERRHIITSLGGTP